MTKKPVDYKQFAPKWGGKMYSAVGNKAQTMKNSGCGPTTCADVLAAFCDNEVTPWTVAGWFMAKGFRTKNSGTKYGAFKWAFQKYKGNGLAKFATGAKKHAAACRAVGEGALVIALMGPGYWTKKGHYIVIWKWEDGCVYACDPGSSVRRKQAEGPFKQQARRYFAYWPER